MKQEALFLILPTHQLGEHFSVCVFNCKVQTELTPKLQFYWEQLSVLSMFYYVLLLLFWSSCLALFPLKKNNSLSLFITE